MTDDNRTALDAARPPRRAVTRRAALAVGGAILLFVVVIGAASWHRREREAAMLRLQPDQMPSAELLRYAVARAKPVFERHCATCHGAGGRGNRTTGVADLTDREWLYGDGNVAQIEQTILFGIRSGHHRAHDLADMPAFGHARPYRRYVLPSFTPSQIGDLADYVRAIGGHAVPLTAVSRGRALFYGGGQCYDCHTSDASGDNFAGAPSLVDRTWLYGDGSRADIVATLTDGRAGICPAWTKRLTAFEIRALSIYVARLSRAGSRQE